MFINRADLDASMKPALYVLHISHFSRNSQVFIKTVKTANFLIAKLTDFHKSLALARPEARLGPVLLGDARWIRRRLRQVLWRSLQPV